MPSTMMEFRLTMVLIPSGRVASATARIMGTGPMASTRSTGSAAIKSAKAWVTKPLRP